jgi:hypothetical protein
MYIYIDKGSSTAPEAAAVTHKMRGPVIMAQRNKITFGSA